MTKREYNIYYMFVIIKLHNYTIIILRVYSKILQFIIVKEIYWHRVMIGVEKFFIIYNIPINKF